ncbi:RAE1 [Lepeophtheirus salmonis]|uniref:RAE1 n=1 Tax=Lepeophtheirus salmonis TaxID=72036 RepID=A0A7R8H9S4_LEPSM|nr:RAE1 [Lepeophtheirus salmonis]CAF2946030.1 RAE1 [Lepeophtheirus salmonis]
MLVLQCILITLRCVSGRLNQLKFSKDYSVMEGPHNKGSPLHVNISINLRNIFEVNEKLSLITVETSIRMIWQDPRIYPTNNGRHLNVLSLRINFDVICQMDFHKYPNDEQLCDIPLESWDTSMDDMKLNWDLSNSVINPNITLDQFSPLIYFKKYDTQSDMTSYSGLIIRIQLQRLIPYHVIQTFIPSIVFVILGWISLFLDPQAIPGRVKMVMLSLLTSLAMFNSVRDSTPQVSYVSYLDIWMSGGGFNQTATTNNAAANTSMMGASTPNPMKDVEVVNPPDDSVSSLCFSPPSLQQNFSHRWIGPILDVCWHDDGSKVFMASCDKQVKCWDLGSNQTIQVAQHDAPVKCFWDTRSPNPIMSINLNERVYCADVDFPMAVVGLSGRGIVIYSLDGQTIKEYKRVEPPLKYQHRCVSIFKDKKKYNLQVLLWDIYAVNDIAFHPIHGTLATVGSDGRYSFWDKDARTKLKTSEPMDQPITKCCFYGKWTNICLLSIIRLV